MNIDLSPHLEYFREVLPEDVLGDALEVAGEDAGRQVAQVHVGRQVEAGAICEG